MVDAFWVILGALLIAATLRDVFVTLFHPLGRGHIGRWVVELISWGGHRLSPRVPAATVLIGPIGYISVVASWAALLALGWALIFFPFLPEAFSFDPGLAPADHSGFDDALYISLVDLTSLGFGDVSPKASLLRILAPMETLLGLGLLTASISWLISIYSAISRRDAFAHEVHLARVAEERLGGELADRDPELLERMLASFTGQLVATRRDLIHFPITFHFRSEDEERALSGLLPFLGRLVAEGSEDGRPDALKIRATMLGMGLDDFAGTLRTRLQVSGETTDVTLGHYDAHQRPGGG
jgi:Ion channel